jgi:glycosyltransferase involved in cell wall biosynthesis
MRTVNDKKAGNPATTADPLVSILMITMNHDVYIAQAINSVMAQQCSFEFELIIGDDASSDRTLEICKNFASRYRGKITVLTSCSNIGMHNNLARVWEAARGTYVAFCEGDDYWIDPHKLAKQVTYLEQRPRYTLCGGITRKIRQNDKGEWIAAGVIEPSSVQKAYGVEYLISNYSFHTSSVLLRKAAVVFPSWFRQQYCADRPLYLLCAERGPVGFVPELMSVYRLHQSGVWAPLALLEKAKRGEALFSVLNEHFGGRYRRRIENTLGEITWSYLAQALDESDKDAAKQLFWRATSHFASARRFRVSRNWLVALVRVCLPRLYERYKECSATLRL